MDGQLERDRALAMRTLRPRQVALPAYEDLTRSGRAEVDRLVVLIQHVRTEAQHG